MIQPHHKLALYMEGALGEEFGKMGYGVLRYSPNEIVCVIDSRHAGKSVDDVVQLAMPRDRTARPSIPVVGTIGEAKALQANALVLGIAPPGGLIPTEWYPTLDEAAASGFLLVNGLHDQLAPRYGSDKVWDIRVEPAGLAPGHGEARHLPCRRLLMIGTDMAVGKMTAGLEIWKLARERRVPCEFVATGQIGITVTGSGVPLDAVRVDYSTGAIEREVLAAARKLGVSLDEPLGEGGSDPLIIVEGQGALIHPGSTATLPLLRGSCPTHLILCHRAAMTTLRRQTDINIPPLREYARLYEDLAEACGTFPRPKTVALAIHTGGMTDAEAQAFVEKFEAETGWPTADPLRHGPEKLLDAL